MNGLEHYEESKTDSLELRHLLCAQVHATLAVAAVMLGDDFDGGRQ